MKRSMKKLMKLFSWVILAMFGMVPGEVAGYVNETWILTGTSAMAAGTGAKVLGVDNSTFNRMCNILDISSFGNQYKSKLAGQKDGTFTLSGNIYVGDTTGQDELEPGDSVYIGVMPSGPTVAGTQAPFIVESFDASYDTNGKQTFSASLSMNGAPVALPIRS